MFLNYQEMMAYVKKLDNRPSLLLHSCCAPCSSHVLLLLKDYFNITVFYSNDNIYPKEEFLKRLDEEKRFCRELGISVLEDDYKHSRFDEVIEGLESLGERSKRCYKCYQLRMERTAVLAQKLGMDFFTTTLSISPFKVTSWINEIGAFLEEKYGVSYLYSDFKKEEGYKHSILLSKEYDLYRQDYCGCPHSLEERRKAIDGKN